MIDFLIAGLLASQQPRPVATPPVNCGNLAVWDAKKNMCVPKPLPQTRPTPAPQTRPAPTNGGSFCKQYPQDPLCGGRIDPPSPPPAP